MKFSVSSSPVNATSFCHTIGINEIPLKVASVCLFYIGKHLMMEPKYIKPKYIIC